MEFPNFNQKIFKTLNNDKITIEEMKAIEPIIIENCKTSVKLMYNYYFLTIVLITIWFLIESSIISKVTIFNVDIDNKKFILFFLPFVSIATYYISVSYMGFNQLSDAGLKQIQAKLYPNIHEPSILDIMIYPSIIELETIKVRLSKDSLISSLWFLIVSFTFLSFPLLMNGVICWKLMFNDCSMIFFPVVYTLIMIKIIFDIVFYIKQVQ